MDDPTFQIAFVLALMVLLFVGFVRERLPPDVVALGAVALLLATGVLGTEDVLAVFSNSAPITIAATFVLSAALERTGVIDNLARWASRRSVGSPQIALAIIFVSMTVLSAFINNTPQVVIMTPIMIGLARSLAIAPSKLLIPLSYASILGGTTTLIGASANILVDGVAQQQGLTPFGMFEITGLGTVTAVVGVAYLLLFGRWLLPNREDLRAALPQSSARKFMADVLVPLDSPLVGKRLKDAGLVEERGLQAIDLIRHDRSYRYALDDLEIAAGDRVVLRSTVGDMLGLREAGDVAFGGRAAHALEPINARETVVMEGIIAPRSRFQRRRVADLNLGRLYGAYILAIHRQGERLSGNFDEVRLQIGDTLLVEGPPESMKRLFEHQELLSLKEPSAYPLRRKRAPIAIVAVILVMGLAAFDVMPLAGIALIAATAVVVFGCLEAHEAYGSIQWNILMLIFGMLAFGKALENTGAAELVVGGAAELLPDANPLMMLALVYLMAMVLTEIISNNAVAILLTPIAIGIANQIGADPRPFVVAVMFAASASFATPIGYQTNTFVYSVGGYRFLDFVKVGLPLNLLLWVTAVFVIPFFWPLSPGD